jgi:hypothetical protein
MQLVKQEAASYSIVIVAGMYVKQHAHCPPTPAPVTSPSGPPSVGPFIAAECYGLEHYLLTPAAWRGSAILFGASPTARRLPLALALVSLRRASADPPRPLFRCVFVFMSAFTRGFLYNACRGQFQGHHTMA